MSEKIYSVSGIILYLKTILSTDYNLNNINVEGEIGNFTNHSSGHWYFTLKDNSALINCAMFRFSNQKVAFLPKNGDKVILKGNISIFEKSGQLQMIVTDMKLSGSGDFYQQYELMKKKLEPLGYFDLARKKQIKKYPEQISIVTGANTAALQDILITINNRWPIVKTILHPAIVQGTEAVESVIKALKEADNDNSDTIILARGGGSIDDLFCFNDERIATCIFNLKTALITGIGHEIDFTIADLVADRRAATPTAAAQMATPDFKKTITDIKMLRKNISVQIENKLTYNIQLLDYFNNSLYGYQNNLTNRSTEIKMNCEKMFLSLNAILTAEKNQKNSCIREIRNILNTKLIEFRNKFKITDKTVFDSFRRRYISSHTDYIISQYTLENACNEFLSRKEFEFNNCISLLDSYSPLKTLQRGYSIVYSKNKVISSISQIEIDDQIQIRLSDGQVKATIDGKE